MNLLNKILGGCIIASSFFSCTEQETKEVKTTNFPNKDSELAIMMRDIVENTQKVKEQIINGEEVEFFIKFEKLHTSTTTEADVRDDGQFTSFANDYTNKVSELIKAETDKTTLYNDMVQACVNCHQQICPGPVKRIRKLKIKE
ncbi:MAG: hypothetical protein HOA52_04290 [Flavobacteriales bacterium]|jgi:hypothetical protein|nr:hypothetical protein [Flavobacteriales bacterium]MBT6808689.1 hypothetical protein [Flavobacteriales bacterium]